jgi:hypothetical protein
MGQVYQCWWRICWEINVFSRFEYHTFYVLYPFVTYLLTLPCTTDYFPFFKPSMQIIKYKLYRISESDSGHLYLKNVKDVFMTINM